MLKKIRIYYWIAEAYIKKYIVYIFIGLVLSIFISYISSLFLKNLLFLKSQKIAIIGNYTKENVPIEVLQKIGRGLTIKNEKGGYENDLAKSIVMKNNGKIYEIVLRDNLAWPNGKPFTARDINYNFQDVKFIVTSAKSGYFILKNSFAPFGELLSIPITDNNLNGLGEYRVEKIEWDGNFIKSIFLTGESRIIYRFYSNEKIAYLAFKMGEVTRIENLLNLSELKLWKKVKIEKKPDPNRVAAIFFNFKGNFITQEKSYRQALAYDINKSHIAEKKAYSPYSYLSPYYNENVKKYFFDPASSENLLDKLDSKNRGKMGFTLYTIPEYEKYAILIAKNWSRDLKIKVKTVKSADIPYQWNAFLTIAQIPEDPDQYALWHSNKTIHFSSYRNLKLDKLLEDGRREVDEEKRREIYNEVQKTLTEDLPAIFLFYPSTYTISY